MNDAGHQYDYPARVGFQIPAADLSAYRGAAAYLNASGSDVVSLQHEYGIFGGGRARTCSRCCGRCGCRW
jgi:hypothetical protein